ncbi:hypothetical protein BDFB_013039 [Asbolus verrucosus]|uniref:Uncharacterized protein n=1 Tax=Asbolus verrucosus TaxID=1661398 RepID=A0A482WCX4_ASBVE|nr:hypothetical protein BDFB_013039 [Asbolus verrucosus]
MAMFNPCGCVHSIRLRVSHTDVRAFPQYFSTDHRLISFLIEPPPSLSAAFRPSRDAMLAVSPLTRCPTRPPHPDRATFERHDLLLANTMKPFRCRGCDELLLLYLTASSYSNKTPNGIQRQ